MIYLEIFQFILEVMSSPHEFLVAIRTHLGLMLKVKLEDYERRESNLSSNSAMCTCEMPIDTVEDMDMPLEGFHANLCKCQHD